MKRFDLLYTRFVIDEEERDRAAMTVEAYEVIQNILSEFYTGWYETENVSQTAVAGIYYYEWTAYVVGEEDLPVVAFDINEKIDTVNGEVAIWITRREELNKEELEWLLDKAIEWGNDEDVPVIKKAMEGRDEE